MEYPYGHRHHRREEDEDENQYRGYPQQPPPPSQVSHVFHSSHEPSGPPQGMEYPHPPPPLHSSYAPDYNYPPPPQQSHGFNYSDSPNYPPPPQQSHGFDYSDSPNYQPPPPPPQSQVTHVQHVSHSSSSGGFDEEVDDHHRHRPHFPSLIHHHEHHKEEEEEVVDEPNFSNKPTVRVFCKAEPNYSLTIQEGKVVLVRSDPSDPLQHWIKDLKFSTKVKDAEGFPSFSLVNKATGLAMKHSVVATRPVQLQPYDPNTLDQTVLWTESKDLGDGYRTIRMVNNIRLNVDAYDGNKEHGGVRDGTAIVLWEWKKGENQRWKIVPY